MEHVNYKRLEKEILVALKGRRTSAQVSFRMGRKFNVVARWISERNNLTVKDFSQFASVCGVSHEQALQKCLGVRVENLSIQETIQFLIGHRSARRVASDLGVSENRVHNWLCGRTCTKFVEVLHLLDIYHSVLLHYVSALVPMDKIPSLEERWTLNQTMKLGISRNPLLEAAVALLELGECQEVAKGNLKPLASYLGVSQVDAALILQDLQSLGMITFINNQIEIIMQNPEVKGGIENGKALGLYWTKQFVKFWTFLNRPTSKSCSSHLILALNFEGEKKLHEEYSKFIQNVRDIASEFRAPASSVKAITLNLLDFEDVKSQTGTLKPAEFEPAESSGRLFGESRLQDFESTVDTTQSK